MDVDTQAIALKSINLQHLNWLRGEATSPVGPLPYWHVYAESHEKGKPAEPYHYVEAPGEGIACTDDVARALLVYSRHWAMSGAPDSLTFAVDCLDFLDFMKADDGTYYNWLRSDGRRETTIANSTSGLHWWTARAFWAIAEAVRVLGAQDPQRAVALHQAATQIIDHLKEAVESVSPRSKVTSGKELPQWLPEGSSALASTFVMALCTYEAAAPNERGRALIQQLCDGIVALQSGDVETYPWYGFAANVGESFRWHTWGSHQTAALAIAGNLLEEIRWIEAAERCAKHFLFRLLTTHGPLYSMDPDVKVFPQLHYAVEPCVNGCLALYGATGNSEYRDLAVAWALWITGNNVASAPMYDPATGRGFDGIDAADRVNYNAGAESTIECLLTLLLLAEHEIGYDELSAARISIVLRSPPS